MKTNAPRPWFSDVAPAHCEIPCIETQMFRNAMRQLAGAVTVVTSLDDEEPCGLTATAVCSLSAEPPRILCCVNLSGRTFQAISKSRKLGINILHTGHLELAKQFAGQGEKTFDASCWAPAATGAPILLSAIVAFDCAVAEMFVMPTHALIVGEIRNITYQDDKPAPLIYHDGCFKTFLTTNREAVD